MIFLEEQLQFLHFIQQGRGPLIDPIFRFLNFFDSQYYLCLLVAFVWIGCSYKWGIRLGFLMIASGFASYVAKTSFDLPRPFFYDPSLAMVKALGHGFPSGGAQVSFLLGALLIYYWKSKWAWPLGLFYILLISFSRMFLGVHFPLDVLGGWVVGFLLFFAFIKSVKPIEKFAAKRSNESLSACLLLFFVLLFIPSFKEIFLAGSLGATSIGVYLSTKYRLYFPPPKKILKTILLGLFAIVSSVLLALVARAAPLPPSLSLFLQVIVVGLWVSLVASPLCKKCFLGNLHD